MVAENSQEERPPMDVARSAETGPRIDTLHRDASALRAWGVTEGAAGMVSQVRGIAQAVGLPYELRDITLRMPWRKMWPGWIPRTASIFRNRQLIEDDAPPRLLVTCGRQAVMTALCLKKSFGDRVFTVHVQDPKISPKLFDLVIAPEHDGLVGPNVIQTRGAVHHVTADVLESAAASAAAKPLISLGQKFIAVLIGGPNRYFDVSVESLTPLVHKLHNATRTTGKRLAILPSRRTPSDVVTFLEAEFGKSHLVWTGQGPNPYLAALALCSHVIVTGDSISMMTEATATGRPVFVEYLPERRRARRFHRFYESLSQAGVTRPFVGLLPHWTYEVRQDTATVAQIIRDRIGISHVTPERVAA